MATIALNLVKTWMGNSCPWRNWVPLSTPLWSSLHFQRRARSRSCSGHIWDSLINPCPASVWKISSQSLLKHWWTSLDPRNSGRRPETKPRYSFCSAAGNWVSTEFNPFIVFTSGMAFSNSRSPSACLSVCLSVCLPGLRSLGNISLAGQSLPFKNKRKILYSAGGLCF